MMSYNSCWCVCLRVN